MQCWLKGTNGQIIDVTLLCAQWVGQFSSQRNQVSTMKPNIYTLEDKRRHYNYSNVMRCESRLRVIITKETVHQL